MKSIQRKPKGSYQHGNLKESLLRAAFQSIKKSGQVDFSLRELAKTIGVSPMAAYRHFPSKESILREIEREGFGILGERFTRSLQEDPSDLQALGIAYVEFAIENPTHFRVMFHPDLHLDGGSPEPRPEDRRAYQLLLDCISLNQKQGRFKNKDTDALAITAWSTVHGLATLIVNGNLDQKYILNFDKTKQVIRQTTSIILSGLMGLD